MENKLTSIECDVPPSVFFIRLQVLIKLGQDVYIGAPSRHKLAISRVITECQAMSQHLCSLDTWDRRKSLCCGWKRIDYSGIHPNIAIPLSPHKREIRSELDAGGQFDE